MNSAPAGALMYRLPRNVVEAGLRLDRRSQDGLGVEWAFSGATKLNYHRHETSYVGLNSKTGKYGVSLGVKDMHRILLPRYHADII